MVNKIVTYKAALMLVMGICVVMCQSCKQGCTDPKAYNYTKGAKQDDATCLYCDSTVTFAVGSTFNTYYDYTTGSPYYGSPVLRVFIKENELIYNGNGCKILGLGTSGNCTRFSFNAEVSNETSMTMVLTGDLTTSTGSQFARYHFDALSIPPYGTVLTNVGSICDNTTFSFYSDLQNYTLHYHQ